MNKEIFLFPTKIIQSETTDDDPRFGQFIQCGRENISDKTRIIIIGFPSDEGIKRNGGRPGSAMAPTAIRKELYKLTPPPDLFNPYSDLLEHTVDAGNLKISGDVETDQEELGKLLEEYLLMGITPVIIGGGHETAYGHFSGYVSVHKPCYVLNWDAHADVRELKNGLAHSGSPFRQALENKPDMCLSYTVAGLQPHSVAKTHLEYIKNHKGYYVMKENIDRDEIDRIYDSYSDDNPIMVSFDIDVVDSSFAPGVSAPSINGLHPDLWLYAAKKAGQNKNVTSFDISEMNPQFDMDGRTAKLAALTIWNFFFGVAERNTRLK